jgi:serine/threonine protein kinase
MGQSQAGSIAEAGLISGSPIHMPVTPPPEDDRTVIPEAPGASSGSTDSRTSTARSAPLPIGAYLRHFEITGHLGEGGFGIVYIARDHHLQRTVAIKEYMPSSLAWRRGDNTIAPLSEQHRETFEAGMNSFRKEARLLAHFDHPGLVKVYEYWDANGTAYMVTPFYEGITFKQYRHDSAAPPTEEWLKKLLQFLIGALQAMHNEHCMHRDISPDNILIRPSGVPVLLDFGAARRVINDMTQALTVILKPGYAPVEQYAQSSANDQGPWTDVYALAGVVYFGITGKAPMPSVARIISDTMPPLSTIAAGRYSEAFLAGLDKALSVRPEHRPQSMHELAVALGLDDSNQNGAMRSGLAPRSTPLPVRTQEVRRETRDPPSQPSATLLLPDTRHARTRLWLLGGTMLSVAAVLFVLMNSRTEESTKVPASPVVAPESPDAQALRSDSMRTPRVDDTNAVPSAPAASDAAALATPESDAGSAPATPESPMSSVPGAEPAQLSKPAVQRAPKPSPTAPMQSASRAQSKAERAAEMRARSPSGTRSERCSDVLSRLQLGESISSEERALFQKECQR